VKNVLFWSDAFEIWKTGAPGLRRMLISNSTMVSIVKNLNVIPNHFSKEKLLVFIQFLEEAHILCPLAKRADVAQEFFRGFYIRQVPDYENVYHPLQMFILLRWLRLAPLKNSPWFISEKFNAYFQKRSLEFKFREKEQDLLKPDNLGEIDHSNQKYWDKRRDQYNKLPNKDMIYPDGRKILKFFGFPIRSIITEQRLILWLKLESLGIGRCDFSLPGYFPMNYDRNPNIEENKDHYEKWISQQMEQLANYLDSDEKQQLTRFHFDIRSEFKKGSLGAFGHNGNWDDLFDLIPTNKKQKLVGWINYDLNWAMIYRYLEICAWKIMGKNIRHNKESVIKPYFCSEEKEEEQRHYRESCIFQFNLAQMNPFTLHVEGGTEEALIEEYFHHGNLPISFQLKIYGGVKKIPYNIKLILDQPEKYSFFLVDYEDEKNYADLQPIVADNGVFFFPDFITENFTVEEFCGTLKSWMETISLSFTDPEWAELREKLEEQKELSNGLISNISKGLPLNTKKAKGFESESILYLQIKRKQEIGQIYHYMQTYLNREGKFRKKFGKILKTGVSEQLRQVIEARFAEPEEKREKFSFEKKLEGFVKDAYSVVYKNPQYL
jgi:hypothetical protein